MNRLVICFLTCLAIPCFGELSSFRITEENDVFTLNNDDQDYTQGMEIQAYYAPEVVGPAGDIVMRGFRIHQLMYTPSDITSTVTPSEDHMWAGLLGLYYDKVVFKDKSAHMLSAGVYLIGPDYSFSEETQRQVHKIIGSKDPSWEGDVVDNEIGVNFGYRYDRQIYHGEIGFLSGDLQVYSGADLGTVFIDAYAGSTVRFGYNVPNDFEIYSINPTVARTTTLKGKSKYSFYGIASTEGKGYLHNLPVEGSLFTDSPSRDAEPFVGFLNAGIAFGFPAGSYKGTLSWLYNWRTKEFKEQEDHISYGSVSFSLLSEF